MKDIPYAQRSAKPAHKPNVKRRKGDSKPPRTKPLSLVERINKAHTFEEWVDIIDCVDGATKGGVLHPDAAAAFKQKSPTVLGLYMIGAQKKPHWEFVADKVIGEHLNGTLTEKDRKDFFERCWFEGIKQRVRKVVYAKTTSTSVAAQPAAPVEAPKPASAPVARGWGRGLEALAARQQATA